MLTIIMRLSYIIFIRRKIEMEKDQKLQKIILLIKLLYIDFFF